MTNVNVYLEWSKFFFVRLCLRNSSLYFQQKFSYAQYALHVDINFSTRIMNMDDMIRSYETNDEYLIIKNET